MSETLSSQRKDTFAILCKHNTWLFEDPHGGVNDPQKQQRRQEHLEEIRYDLDPSGEGLQLPVEIYINSEQLPDLAAVHDQGLLVGKIIDVSFRENYTMEKELSEELTIIVATENDPEGQMSFPIPISGVVKIEDRL